MSKPMTGHFNPVEAAAAQRRFCEQTDYPLFAPVQGICWRCHRNIYAPVTWGDGTTTGYTVERAGQGGITGCPHCHVSFCE